MISESDKLSPLQIMLKQACADTSVTTRELVKELSFSDLTDLREGELTVDDLREIVLDLASGKDDSIRFKIAAGDEGNFEMI